MKILHVLGQLNPSGAESMLRCAAAHWETHGVRCDILSTGEDSGPYTETLRRAGYVIHHLPFQKSPAHFLDFRNLLQEARYDCIHLHAERASFWYGLISLTQARRVVRTVHSTFAFRGALQLRRGVQRRTLARLGVEYIAISQGVQDTERLHYGIHPTLIHNWIDTAHFKAPDPEQKKKAKAAFGISQDSVVLTTLGNCSEVKNHAAVLDALQNLSTSERSKLHYLHVGMEDSNHSERKLAQQMGLSSFITFAGWQANPLPALHATDIFIMPSLREGMGLAAVEAMATGLPAIASDIPGLRDLGKLFHHLTLVSPDGKTLADALRRMMLSLPATQTAALAVHPQIAERQFSPQRGVAEYVRAYQGRSH